MINWANVNCNISKKHRPKIQDYAIVSITSLAFEQHTHANIWLKRCASVYRIATKYVCANISSMIAFQARHLSYGFAIRSAVQPLCRCTFKVKFNLKLNLLFNRDYLSTIRALQNITRQLHVDHRYYLVSKSSWKVEQIPRFQRDIHSHLPQFILAKVSWVKRSSMYTITIYIQYLHMTVFYN